VARIQKKQQGACFAPCRACRAAAYFFRVAFLGAAFFAFFIGIVLLPPFRVKKEGRVIGPPPL
jgi:hypothetical protein